MVKANYYIRGLKPSTCKDILEKKRSMPHIMRSSLFDHSRIAEAKRCLQRVLMEYQLPRESINYKDSKKDLRTSMLGDTPQVPSTGFTGCA